MAPSADGLPVSDRGSGVYEPHLDTGFRAPFDTMGDLLGDPFGRMSGWRVPGLSPPRSRCMVGRQYRRSSSTDLRARGGVGKSKQARVDSARPTQPVRIGSQLPVARNPPYLLRIALRGHRSGGIEVRRRCSRPTNRHRHQSSGAVRTRSRVDRREAADVLDWIDGNHEDPIGVVALRIVVPGRFRRRLSDRVPPFEEPFDG